MNAKANFSERFPDLRSYVAFEEPNFIVKVGNFRTRLEAFAALERLRAVYPHAFVIRDVLNVTDLLNIFEFSEEEGIGEDDF